MAITFKRATSFLGNDDADNARDLCYSKLVYALKTSQCCAFADKALRKARD